jgi:hypothetical protein
MSKASDRDRPRPIAGSKQARPTALAQALLDATIHSLRGLVLLGRVERAAEKPGVGVVVERQWDARLSRRTAQQLQKENES